MTGAQPAVEVDRSRPKRSRTAGGDRQASFALGAAVLTMGLLAGLFYASRAPSCRA